MTPSESELRASLRTGEGDRLDTDAVLAHTRAARHDRRRTLAAIGGAVAAVLAVGGVITGVQLDRSEHAAPLRSSAAPGRRSSPVPPVDVICPGSAPAMRYGTGTAPLFPDDVTSIKVCVYDVERLTTSKDITEPAAGSYAERFNALPAKRGRVACPQYLTQITVALIPVTPSGPAPVVVGRIGGCGTTSNGTASRDAGPLLTELQIGTSSTRIPIGPSHTMSHGPGPR
jgi:hypothetical protein